MKQENMDVLLKATADIREAYIEEAAIPVARQRPRWVRFVAAAVALALIVSLGIWLWPQESQKEEIIPNLVIRAYAAEGEKVSLDGLGDSVSVQTDFSDLFPDKQVYVLEVSLEGYEGDYAQLLEGRFGLWHWGARTLKPGESDEELAVQWLSSEKDGVFGYRLIGWCAKSDWIGIEILGENNQVLHQREISIEYADDDYQMDVRIAYTYQPNRPTEALIDLVLQQDYSMHVMLSSDLSQRFLIGYTGFGELIQRPDAPAKLLERFICSQNGKEQYPMNAIFVGMGGSNDWLLNVLLCWDEIWNGLTPREQALALGHGCSRLMLDSDSNRFGKKLGCFVQITAPDTAREDSILEVSYNGIVTREEDDHVRFFPTIGTDENGKEVFGWRVAVCFEGNMEVTFTVLDQAGNILQQEKYLVLRIEEGNAGHFEIEKLTP